jgi:hypothetical protein
MLRIFNINKLQYLLVISLIIIVIFPISLIFFIVIFEYLKINKYILTRVLLSLYLGFINANKFLESDLLGYSISYENSRLYGYMGSISREPLYFIFELMFSNLYIPFSFFIFFITFLSYMVLYKAALNFSKDLRFIDSLFLILFITFFFNIFNLSAHLVRQFIAMTIFIYGISFQDRKKLIFLSFLALLVHSSMVLFIPVVFFKTIYKKMSLKSGIFLFIRIGFMLIVGNYFIIILSNVPFLEYVIDRSVNNSETFTTNESIGLYGYVFLFLSLFLNILNQFKNKNKGNNFLFYNIFLFLVIFILVVGSFNDLLAYRYLFYLYLFFPFLIFEFFKFFKKFNFLTFFKFFIIVFLVFSFYFKIENGVWKYGPIQDLLLLLL